MQHLIDAIASATKFSHAQLLGRCLSQPLVRARWAVVRTACRDLGMSHPAVAGAMDRDTSSIWHAARRAEALYDKDPAFKIMCNWLSTRS